ncbi:hypothetical protein AAC387_Pa05g3446 [Persea americana]
MKILTPKMEGKISQQTREDQCASDFRSINCNPKSFQKNCLAIQIKGQEKKISLRVSQAFSKIKGLQCLQRRKMVQSLRMRYKVSSKSFFSFRSDLAIVS